MAWQGSLRSLAYDDDEVLDRMLPAEPEPPEYPLGCLFTVCEADLEKAGCEDGEIGDIMRFAAMGEVTSVSLSADTSRVELEIREFAGDDGKFFTLEQPAHISLCCPELEKLDLDADCEIGDTLHLVGEARLERMNRSEFGEMATLQVVAADVEDESEESREG